MKNILFIAYYFPPSVDVGAKRAEGFVHYLPEFGYQATVLTVKNGNYSTVTRTTAQNQSTAAHRLDVVRVAETRWPTGFRRARGPSGPGYSPRKGLIHRALRRCFREILYVPDAYRGFFGPACRAALDVIRQRPIDLIFTTSGPYTLLRVGYHLTLKTGIPWVADFRDLWVENHFGYPYSPARRRLDSFLQTRWLSKACRITTATRGLKARLQASGYATKPIESIYNGYLEMLPETPSDPRVTDVETLRICFTGKLYEHPAHTAAPFFEVLARVRKTRHAGWRGLRVDFYGIVNTDFWVQIERFGLHDVVRFHGMVSREEAVRAQIAADVLFLLIPDTREQEVSVYSKTFEYMATRKPLLAIVPPMGEAAHVLGLAGMGNVFSAHETERMVDYISELLLTKARLGHLPQQGDPRVIETFSYKNLTAKLAQVFDAAIGSTSAVEMGWTSPRRRA